jgi:hypothetical protein
MLVDTICIGFIVTGATLLGARVLCYFSFIWTDFLERVLASMGVGLIIYSYCMSALGVFGGLYSWAAYSILGLSFLAGYRFIILLWQRRREIQIPRLSPITFAMLVVLLILIGINYMSAVTPVFGGTGSDDVAYQVGIPKVFVNYHSIVLLPENIRSYIPFNQNMLYVFAILLESTEVAKLLNFVFGIGIFGFTYHLARRYVNKNVALLAGLICYTNPVFTQNGAHAYIGLGLAFYFLLGIVALLKWYETKENGWLILSAMCCGVNIGSTYLGFVYLAAMAPLFVMHIRRWTIIPVLLFSGVVILIASPWYIKNWVVAGNPLFPFFAQGVTDPYILMMTQLLRQVHEVPPVSFLGMLMFPWELLVRGNWYDFWGGFGHLYFIFTPLYLIWGVRRYSRELLILFITMLAFFVVLYCLGNFTIRYFVAIVPLSTLVVVAAIYLFQRQTLVRWATIATVTLSLLFGLVVVWKENQHNMPYIMQGLTKEDFLKERVFYYASCQYLNALSPETTTVFLCGRAFPIYFIMRTVGPNFTAYEALSDVLPSDDFAWFGTSLTRLREQGVSHVLDVSGQFIAFRQKQGDERHFRLVFQEENATVYEVHYD